MIGSPFFSVRGWESAGGHGGLRKLEGKNPPEPRCAGCALCLATFGTTSAINGNWTGAVAICAIHCTGSNDRRVLDYGLHGERCVLLCGINGTRDLVVH